MPSFHKEKENPLQGEIDQKTSVVEDLKREIQNLLVQQKQLRSDVATLASSKVQAQANADKIIADATAVSNEVINNANKKMSEAKVKEQEVLALADANNMHIAKELDAVKAAQDRIEAKLEGVKKYEESVAARDLKLKAFEQEIIIRENKCLDEAEVIAKRIVELDIREKQIESSFEDLTSQQKKLERDCKDLQMLKEQYDVDINALHSEKDKLLQDKKDIASREASINDAIKYVDNKKKEIHSLDIESNRLLIEARANIVKAQVAKQDAEFQISSIQAHKDELKMLIDAYNKKTEVK